MEELKVKLAKLLVETAQTLADSVKSATGFDKTRTTCMVLGELANACRALGELDKERLLAAEMFDCGAMHDNLSPTT